MKSAFYILLLFFPFLLLSQTLDQNRIDSLIAVIEKSADDTILANNYYILSRAYHDQGKYDLAHDYVKKMSQLSNKINYEKGILRYYLQNSQIAFINSEFNEAMKFSIEGLKMAEARDNKDFQCSFSILIGNISLNQKNLARAVSYYEKAIEIGKTENDLSTLDPCYNNLGSIYFESKEYDKALYSFEQSLAIGIQRKDSVSIAGSKANIGTIYYAKMEYPRARDYFKQALDIYIKHDFKSEMASMYLNLALVNQDVGEYRLAEDQYLQAIQLWRELKVKNYLVIGYETIAGLYSKTGNYESAYYYENLCKLLSDSIYNEDIIAQTSELQSKYETDKQKAEIKLLNKEKEQQRLYTYGGGIGFVLMLMIAIISFRAYRNKQKANLIINEQNKLVEAQKKMVEMKQKEVLDSIHYAKKIQTALMSNDNYINNKLQRMMKP